MLLDTLISPFINLLTFFSWLVPGHNIAWSIILLTLVVRFILILPSKRAAQAQRRMAQMQPLLDELKVEYGDDKQGLAAAQMELYKKNQINPFGACLPLLIQLPLIFILYRAIYSGLTPGNAHLYSWVPRPDHITSYFLGINLLKPNVFSLGGIALPGILPWLAAILQYFQMRLTLPPKPVVAANAQPDSASMIQQQTAIIMPIFTLIWTRSFAGGVVIYWITTTLFSIAQQYFVNKEKLRLSGVDKVVKEVEKDHPEYTARLEKLKDEVEKGEPAHDLPAPTLSSSKAKKGVTVTVRRKQK